MKIKSIDIEYFRGINAIRLENVDEYVNLLVGIK